MQCWRIVDSRGKIIRVSMDANIGRLSDYLTGDSSLLSQPMRAPQVSLGLDRGFSVVSLILTSVEWMPRIIIDHCTRLLWQANYSSQFDVQVARCVSDSNPFGRCQQESKQTCTNVACSEAQQEALFPDDQTHPDAVVQKYDKWSGTPSYVVDRRCVLVCANHVVNAQFGSSTPQAVRPAAVPWYRQPL